MKLTNCLFATGLILTLAACQTTGRTPSSRDSIPQAVWDRIPTSTPIEEIRQGPDGCFWYLRHGPLETVLVPVRDIDSWPVCDPELERPDGTELAT